MQWLRFNGQRTFHKPMAMDLFAVIRNLSVHYYKIVNNLKLKSANQSLEIVGVLQQCKSKGKYVKLLPHCGLLPSVESEQTPA